MWCKFHNNFTIYTPTRNNFKLFRGDIIKRRYWCAVKSLQIRSLGQEYYYRTSGTKKQKQIQHTACQKQGPKSNDLLWPRGRPVGICAWVHFRKCLLSSRGQENISYGKDAAVLKRNTQRSRWDEISQIYVLASPEDPWCTLDLLTPL